jgi:hypothetical protein
MGLLSKGIPPECKRGHPLDADRIYIVTKGTAWACKECTKASKTKSVRVLRRRTSGDRACVQCGEPLKADASSREKWCPTGCFRAWYIARNPDYQVISGQRRRKPGGGAAWGYEDE